MKLIFATYEFNGTPLTISKLPGHRVRVLVSADDIEFKRSTETEETCWHAANEVLIPIVGLRKRDRSTANVTNSEIHDLARVIGEIGGYKAA